MLGPFLPHVSVLGHPEGSLRSIIPQHGDLAASKQVLGNQWCSYRASEMVLASLLQVFKCWIVH